MARKSQPVSGGTIYLEGKSFVPAREQHKPWFRKAMANQQYSVLKGPFFWLRKAEDLHDAAAELWRSHKRNIPTQLMSRPRYEEFAMIAFMLAGMGHECMFKAYLIAKSSTVHPVSEPELRKIAKGAHDLCELLKKTGLRSNRDDRFWLHLLSHCVRWSGRYPLPRTEEEMRLYWKTPGLRLDQMWEAHEGVVQKFHGVIREAVTATMRPPRERNS